MFADGGDAMFADGGDAMFADGGRVGGPARGPHPHQALTGGRDPDRRPVVGRGSGR